MSESPPKFHSDWESFPPNSHQIPTIPTRFTRILPESHSYQDPTKFQVEYAMSARNPAKFHLWLMSSIDYLIKNIIFNF